MNLITLAQMHVDDVDSGLPRLTLDASDTGGPGPVTFALALDAVRGLVDALIGVAPPSPGQARIVIKVDTSDLRAMLTALHSDQTPTWSGLPPSECSLESIRAVLDRYGGAGAAEPAPEPTDSHAASRRIRKMLAPMLGLGFDEEAAEVMVDRATRIPRAAVLWGCPAEVVARGWCVQRPLPRGDGTWIPGAILAGRECKEWGTSLDVPEGVVGDDPDRGLDVALAMLESRA